MVHIFEIYLYICGVIVSIAIIAGLTGLVLNLIVYTIQSSIGFKKFHEILRDYNSKK